MTTPEDHGMFRSKPNEVSVCGGMCPALPFAQISTDIPHQTKQSKSLFF